jgi:ubiquinone/menaquinone biosynthesis C-methylase UbiE
MREGWKLRSDGPRAYETYLVPALFTECADRLLDHTGVGAGERVVDVACGTGIVARQAAGRVGPGGAVTGVDVNEEMLAVARFAGAGAAAPIRWLRADATALPVDDGGAEVVLCQHGLQYVRDRPAALREAHRVLRPGGRVGVAVWRALDRNPAWDAFVRVLEKNAHPDAAEIMRAPFSGPDGETLRGLLAAAGFAEIRVGLGVVVARFPSARDFLRRQIAASPLAGPLGGLDVAGLDALAADLGDALRDSTDDAGVTFPMEAWLVAGQRTYRRSSRNPAGMSAAPMAP